MTQAALLVKSMIRLLSQLPIVSGSLQATRHHYNQQLNRCLLLLIQHPIGTLLLQQLFMRTLFN